MSKTKNKYYLYSHTRLDKDEIFYIGVGSKPPNYTIKCYKRAYSKYSRNRFWWFIVDKTEYRVDILEESEDLQYIKNREAELIKLYGKKSVGEGTLVNIEDGGNYKCGYKLSDETTERIRIASTGRRHTEEAKEKIAKAFSKPVIVKDLLGNVVSEFESIKTAAKEYNSNRSIIDKSIKYKKYIKKGPLQGYIFELKNY